ncbi:NAD-dependent epimerase/dehydratase family protein [Vibrio breoganii]|uniref:NAD-dependent epimerase/dehydratase family protein n=1 Tax=Vibrio breoganii TaxID=553239 RepID=UPI000C84EF04|nr:NAD(P)-dependent oxidoreductase [Vibrio breoganii]PML28573.1 hypothetical protein BCT82_06860 [Vibrio breoganii]
MKYLITGGSGFIGTNLVSRLQELGHEVLNLDIERPRCSEHASLHQFCDVRKLEELSVYVSGFQPDILIHLAARTDLLGKKLEDYNANTLGVANVCEAVSKCNSISSVLFASSMLVNKPGHLPSDKGDYSPHTVYGESKVVGESIVQDWKSKLPKSVIFRPTSIWGPWFSEPYVNFFRSVLKGHFVNIGERFGKKTFGYVGNAVNQIISLSELEHEGKLPIYIGDSPGINPGDWADKISIEAKRSKPTKVPYALLKALALIGDVCKLVGIKFPMTSFRLTNMTTNNVLDCNLVEKNNTFEKISMIDGINSTINWMNKNENH